jgi:hypothetical protein
MVGWMVGWLGTKWLPRHRIRDLFRGCYRPSSRSIGVRPRLSAPMTLVVIPEECQSIPILKPEWMR